MDAVEDESVKNTVRWQMCVHVLHTCVGGLSETALCV